VHFTAKVLTFGADRHRCCGPAQRQVRSTPGMAVGVPAQPRGSPGDPWPLAPGTAAAGRDLHVRQRCWSWGCPGAGVVAARLTGAGGAGRCGRGGQGRLPNSAGHAARAGARQCRPCLRPPCRGSVLASVVRVLAGAAGQQGAGVVVDRRARGFQRLPADPQVVAAQQQVHRVWPAGRRRHDHRDDRPGRAAAGPFRPDQRRARQQVTGPAGITVHTPAFHLFMVMPRRSRQ